MKKLDLRKIPCPKNTSKALIYLSTMDSQETLEILLDDGEPIENVPASLSLEGHKILSQTKTPENYWVLVVEAT